MNGHSVSIHNEGVGLSIKIGSHCRAIISAYEEERLLHWLLSRRDTPVQTSHQLDLQADKATYRA